VTVVGALAWLWMIGTTAAVLRFAGVLPARRRSGRGQGNGASVGALPQGQPNALPGDAPPNALADELAALALSDPTLAAEVVTHYLTHADPVVALQAMLVLATPLTSTGRAALDQQRLLTELRDAYARGKGEALLLEALQSTSPSRSALALKVLAEAGPRTFASPELEPRVLERLTETPAGQREAICAALATIGSRDAVIALHAALDGGSLQPRERSVARQAIATIHTRLDPAAAGALSVAAPTQVGALSAAEVPTEGALSEVEGPPDATRLPPRERC